MVKNRLIVAPLSRSLLLYIYTRFHNIIVSKRALRPVRGPVCKGCSPCFLGTRRGFPPYPLPIVICTLQASRPFNLGFAHPHLFCAFFVYFWCRALFRLCYLTLFFYHFCLFCYFLGGLPRVLLFAGWAFLPFCTFSGRSVVTLGPSSFPPQHLHPLGLLLARFPLVLLSTPWLRYRTIPSRVPPPPLRLSRLTPPLAASYPSASPTLLPHLGRPLCPRNLLNTGSSENPTSNISPPVREQNKPNRILFVSFAPSACSFPSGAYSPSVPRTHGIPS